MKFTDKVEEAKELIKDTLDKYKKIAVACSFGKDSMVVLHLALQLDPDIPIFSVMTPFKFKETFEYKDRITREWSLNIKTYMRNDVIQDYFKDPDACCQYYKVDMTREAVKELDAWICGLRRTEAELELTTTLLKKRVD